MCARAHGSIHAGMSIDSKNARGVVFGRRRPQKLWQLTHSRASHDRTRVYNIYELYCICIRIRTRRRAHEQMLEIEWCGSDIQCEFMRICIAIELEVCLFEWLYRRSIENLDIHTWCRSRKRNHSHTTLAVDGIWRNIRVMFGCFVCKMKSKAVPRCWHEYIRFHVCGYSFRVCCAWWRVSSQSNGVCVCLLFMDTDVRCFHNYESERIK